MDELKAYKIKLSNTTSAYNNESLRLEKLIKLNDDSQKESEKAAKELKGVLSDIEKYSKERLEINEEIKTLGIEISKQNKILSDVKDKIKEEQSDNAKIMKTLLRDIHVLRVKEDKIKEVSKDRLELSNQNIQDSECEQEVLLEANKTISEGNAKLEKKGVELDIIIEKNNKIIKAHAAKQVRNADDINNYNNEIVNLGKKEKEVNKNLEVANLKLKDIGKDIQKEKGALAEEQAKLKEMKRYRFALIKKGRQINRALEFIINAHKSANIPLDGDITPINVPAEE